VTRQGVGFFAGRGGGKRDSSFPGETTQSKKRFVFWRERGTVWPAIDWAGAEEEGLSFLFRGGPRKFRHALVKSGEAAEARGQLGAKKKDGFSSKEVGVSLCKETRPAVRKNLPFRLVNRKGPSQGPHNRAAGGTSSQRTTRRKTPIPPGHNPPREYMVLSLPSCQGKTLLSHPFPLKKTSEQRRKKTPFAAPVQTGNEALTDLRHFPNFNGRGKGRAAYLPNKIKRNKKKRIKKSPYFTGRTGSLPFLPYPQRSLRAPGKRSSFLLGRREKNTKGWHPQHPFKKEERGSGGRNHHGPPIGDQEGRPLLPPRGEGTWQVMTCGR